MQNKKVVPSLFVLMVIVAGSVRAEDSKEVVIASAKE